MLVYVAGWFDTAVRWDNEGDHLRENGVWLLHVGRDLRTRLCKEKVSRLPFLSLPLRELGCFVVLQECNEEEIGERLE